MTTHPPLFEHSKNQLPFVVQKPRKVVVPMAVGLAWRYKPQILYEEKLDGKFQTRRAGCAVVVGELMGNGSFFAFDCVALNEKDIRQAPLWDRLACLEVLNLPRPETGNGGEFLAQILARGGEGVVAKDLNAPYGEMLACKRLETWICRVASMNGGKQSVKIVDSLSGQPRGNLPLLGGKCDRVRIGSLVKVEGCGLTSAGLVREPRVCRDSADSWLVKF